MKQHITVEQLNELSGSAKEKLKMWWEPEAGDKVLDLSFKHTSFLENSHEGYWNDIADPDFSSDGLLPLLSLGQMIEFLNEKQEYQFHIFRRTFDWKVIVSDLHYGKEIGGELCDHLWEAVKEVLEHD